MKTRYENIVSNMSSGVIGGSIVSYFDKGSLSIMMILLIVIFAMIIVGIEMIKKDKS